MFAELFITSPESITDEFFDEMKTHFSESQLVEMMIFVDTYNMLQRFNTAIDLTPQDGDNLVVVSNKTREV